MNPVAHFFSEEPVRAYVYTVIVGVVSLLVGLGVVTAGVFPLIVTVASVVLAVGGTEISRSVVTPVQNCNGSSPPAP